MKKKYGAMVVTGMILANATASVQAAYGVADIPTGVIGTEREQIREHIKDAGEVVNSTKISVADENSLKVSIPLNKVIFAGIGIENFQEKLQAIAQPHISEKSTFGDIQQTVSKTTKYLRSKGYIVAIAYLPQQEIEKGGSVTIEVVLGTIHSIGVDNTSKMKPGRVQEFVNVLKPGQIVQQRDLDRLLFNLNDIPGIKKRKAISNRAVRQKLLS